MAIERVERRLAAILAADVAGYSPAHRRGRRGDPRPAEGARREFADPKIAEHRGRIVKTTGDGLLLEFASVVDALRCAIEVQRGMAERNAGVPADRRIEFRIGINLGDIIEDGDIFGDGVNVAARLEALAEPGGICVSAARARGPSTRQARLRVRRFGGAEGQEHRSPGARLPDSLGENSPSAVSAERLTRPSLALPDKPSVAVLPFTNMSSDPEQEFFADGIAEDVITALSRYPSCSSSHATPPSPIRAARST